MLIVIMMLLPLVWLIYIENLYKGSEGKISYIYYILHVDKNKV